MLNRNYTVKSWFIFLHHLTVLVGNRGNIEVASFSLNAVYLRHTKCIEIFFYSQLNHPSFDCLHQGSEHCINSSVPLVLNIYKVFHGVSRHVKSGSCSVKPELKITFLGSLLSHSVIVCMMLMMMIIKSTMSIIITVQLS